MEQPKLTIEIAPRNVHYRRLRDGLPDKAWDKIRRWTLEQADHQCEICGATSEEESLFCDEVWEYDEHNLVQKLVGFQTLCPSCHEVKHADRAGMNGRFEEVEAHLAKVNDWHIQKAKNYLSEQLALYMRRSRKEWKQDLSLLNEAPYSRLLEKIEYEF